jgi:protein-tyrosine phosphatase
MQAVAAGRGLALTGKSRQFTPQDFERFDLIVPMDESNRSNILQLARSEEDQAKVRLFRQFDPQADADTAVPDPYYGGIDGFEHVFEIIERGAAGLLDALESGELD